MPVLQTGFIYFYLFYQIDLNAAFKRQKNNIFTSDNKPFEARDHTHEITRSVRDVYTCINTVYFFVFTE